MFVLTRRNLFSFAAGTAASFLFRIPEGAGHAVSEDKFVWTGGIDLREAIHGNNRFWYLAPGKEVPHRIAEHDRIVWKLLRDQGTEPLVSSWPGATIHLEVELELPDLFESGSKVIISPRMRRLCDRYQVKAEYLPVTITDPKGKVAADRYAIMHPLERIDCIDFAASDFDRYGSGDNFIVARFRRLVFLPEKIGGRAVFRPQRYSPIFASNAFRKALLRAGLAVEFYAPEGQGPRV